MAGLVPAINVFSCGYTKTWMPGTRPGMTSLDSENTTRSFSQMLHQLLRRTRQRAEAAGADCQFPVRPGVADFDHHDRHESRATPCRRFRHHRNADTCRHHLADRVEISQACPNSQAHAEPGGVFCNMGLKRGRTGQPDEVAISQLLKIDLAAAGKLSASRGHQHQAILAE